MSKEPTELALALATLIKGAQEAQELQRPASPNYRLPPGSGYGVEDGAENERHLRDYWRSIRNRKWVIIILTTLITLGATVYMSRKPDIYQAYARVQVDLETTSSGLSSSKNAIVFNAPIRDPTYLNTQLQVLTSNALLNRVIKTLDLEHNQSFLYPQSVTSGSTWQRLLRMIGWGRKAEPGKQQQGYDLTPSSAVAPATAHEDLEEVNRLAPYVGILRGMLEVEQIKDTRLLEIRVNHPDPVLASKIVNAIAEVFVHANLEKKTETSATTGDFLMKRVAELQATIRNDEERLLNYAKSNQILSLEGSQNTVVDRLAGLNRQLLEAENDRKLAEAAYRAASAPGAADAMVESDSKTIADAESKLNELQQKREQLLVEATEEAPEVKEIEKQMAVLGKQISESRKRATSTIKTNLETRYRQALAREDALRKSFNQQRGETLTQNEAAINYRILQQEIETNKNLLNGLLQGSKENEVLQAGTPNNIHVVDYAPIAKSPVGPRRMQVIVVAFLLSLIFGVGLALFLEYLDNTISSPEDVETTLRLPALSVIPSMKSGPARRLLTSGAGNENGHKNGHSKSSRMLISADTKSSLAESYKQLRTSVLLSTASRAPKTILITSSVPGEGKTTTSVNTAISLGQVRGNVLIIDADMRRPRIHSILGLDNRYGLSNILSSELSEAEMLNVVQHDKANDLYVLTSGTIPPNPAELIGSEQMQRLLSLMRDSFDHIIIDSPPVASFTDSVILSSLVDGVILVVHGGETSRNIVWRSRQILSDIGARILGVVINNVNVRSHEYYYYQHYYKAYYPQVDPEATS